MWYLVFFGEIYFISCGCEFGGFKNGRGKVLNSGGNVVLWYICLPFVHTTCPTMYDTQILSPATNV